MPSTYEPIATTTLGSATASVTFSSISSAYTDLVLVVTANVTGAAVEIQVGNGSIDTGSNYSRTLIYGDGSSAASIRDSNQTKTYATVGDTTSNFGVARINFFNYSNTSVYKTLLIRSDNAPGATVATVSLWRSTSAINTIKITGVSAANMAAGSTFTIYGIKAA